MYKKSGVVGHKPPPPIVKGSVKALSYIRVCMIEYCQKTNLWKLTTNLKCIHPPLPPEKSHSTRFQLKVIILLKSGFYQLDGRILGDKYTMYRNLSHRQNDTRLKAVHRVLEIEEKELFFCTQNSVKRRFLFYFGNINCKFY